MTLTNTKTQKIRLHVWQILGYTCACLTFIGLVCSLCGRKPAKACLDTQAKLAGSAQALSINAADLFPCLDRQLNILVLGVDSNGPKTQRFVGTRSDTMILLHLDPFGKRVCAISIPRDTKVELCGTETNPGCNKINAAYAIGGPQMALQTARHILNIPIDHYIVIDTEGLRRLLQELGPISVMVEKPMHYIDHTAHLSVDLEPWLQSLDANQAEGYIRYRHDGMGDIGRIERQQWLLRQLGPKLTDPGVLFKLPQLFQIADQYVVTDLSVQDMMKTAKFLRGFDTSRIETAVLPGSPAYVNGISYWVLDTTACQATVERLAGCDVSGQPTAPGCKDSRSRRHPLTFIIKYPRGSEYSAAFFEDRLKAAGCRVLYKYAVDPAQCGHEQLIQKSRRAGAQAKASLIGSVNLLANWPLSVSIEPNPCCDFELIISPTATAQAAQYLN